MSSPNLQSAPSFFQRATGNPVNPLWVLRFFTIAALACLALSLLVWKSGNAHDFCIGLAAGLLIGLLAQTFAIHHVELDQSSQRSEVDTFSLTR